MEPQTDTEIFDQIFDLVIMSKLDRKERKLSVGEIRKERKLRVGEILKTRILDGAKEYRTVQLDEITLIMSGTNGSESRDPYMREAEDNLSMIKALGMGMPPRLD